MRLLPAQEMHGNEAPPIAQETQLPSGLCWPPHTSSGLWSPCSTLRTPVGGSLPIAAVARRHNERSKPTLIPSYPQNREMQPSFNNVGNIPTSWRQPAQANAYTTRKLASTLLASYRSEKTQYGSIANAHKTSWHKGQSHVTPV